MAFSLVTLQVGLLNGHTAGGLLIGCTVGGLLTGDTAGGLLTGHTAGGLLTGHTKGGLLTGHTTGCLLNGHTVRNMDRFVYLRSITNIYVPKTMGYDSTVLFLTYSRNPASRKLLAICQNNIRKYSF